MNNKKILIIDDELNILKSLQRALEDDFNVEIALGAEVATTMLDNTFDIILCDFMMPNMDGKEFYDYLMKHQPGLEKRLIFMTGGKYAGDIQKFFDHTKNPCLFKPFTHEELLSIIERIDHTN